MLDCLEYYIDGTWVKPLNPTVIDVIDPATETAIGRVALGTSADVDRAVRAARSAFASYSQSSRTRRLALLEAVAAEMERRLADLADAMMQEMGAPRRFALESQAQSGLDHTLTMIEVLKRFAFEELRGTTLIAREPIGVCGMITPWNWPINQIACKVIPALAAGCTMVLKPSEAAPLSARVFAEILHTAGVPAGVFNLVYGDGAGVGVALAEHSDIDMVSFTGSTRAGIDVARRAAGTVKRVAQELGGNSPNLILDDADLEKAVANGALACMSNSGQSCNSPARMLIARRQMPQAIEIAKAAVEALKTGDPTYPLTDLGPVSNRRQFDKINQLIESAVAGGASLVTGGPGRPAGLNRGYYIRPTILANVTEEMEIFHQEIFGPVLQMIAYDNDQHAVDLANNTEYGLAAYVQSRSLAYSRRIAARLRAGWVELNHAPFDYFAPFGGYKKSGNGREYGEFGLLEFLEVKATMGWTG